MTRKQGKPPGQRQLRVGEEIRHALVRILERGHIRDPDVAGRPITITEVKVSPDLRAATVFFVPLGGGETATLVAGLKRVRAYLRHELAQAVLMRVAPELWFEVDLGFEVASRIEAILHRPEVRRDLEAGETEDLAQEGPDSDQEGRDDGA